MVVAFEEPEVTTAPWRKFAFWGLISIFLVGCVFSARPVYHYFKNRRAEVLCLQAQKLIESKSWQAAAEKAYSAYQLAPANPTIIRTLAELFTATGSEQALPFWEAYLAATNAGLDERRKIVVIAQKAGRFDLAQKQIFLLLENSKCTTEDLLLAADFYMRVGNRVMAANMIHRSLSLGGENPDSILKLATLLTTSPVLLDRQEAKQHWFWLLSHSPDHKLQSLIVLSKMDVLSTDEARSVTEQLESISSLTPEPYLAAQDLKIRLRPESKSKILADTLLHFKRATAVEQLQLARWLCQQREFQSALRVVDEKTAFQSQDFLLVRLDALAGLGQWAQVSGLLQKENIPLQPVFKELYLARAETEKNNPEAASLHWNSVYNLAGDKPEVWIYIGEYAERFGAWSEAEKIYRQLALKPETSRIGYASLIRLSEIRGDTRQLRDLMKEVSALFPSDPIPQNDLAYLNLLLQENVDASFQAASKLVKEHPAFLSFRITLALAMLRTQRSTEAMQLLSADSNIDWNIALPGWRAVFAATLAQNNNVAEATKQASQIAISRLKPEEKNLLRSFLKDSSLPPDQPKSKPLTH